MDKEMLKILNDLSKKSTTELALQIMELSSENLILEHQCRKQKEVIDKAVGFLIKIKFDKTDKYICISEYIEYQQLLDILKEVSE